MFWPGLECSIICNNLVSWCSKRVCTVQHLKTLYIHTYIHTSQYWLTDLWCQVCHNSLNNTSLHVVASICEVILPLRVQCTDNFWLLSCMISVALCFALHACSLNVLWRNGPCVWRGKALIGSCFDRVDGYGCVFPVPDLTSVLVIIKLSQLCHDPDQGPNVPPRAVNRDKLVHN